MHTTKERFEALLDDAARFHGHLCGGQIVGVRMAMAGLREPAFTIQGPGKAETW